MNKDIDMFGGDVPKENQSLTGSVNVDLDESSFGGIDPYAPISGAADPSQNYAQITQAQYLDQVNRFDELTQMAVDDVMDPEQLMKQQQAGLGYANEAVANSYERNANRQETLRSRFGVKQTAREKKAQTTRNAASRGALAVMTRNNTRGYLDDQNMSLLAGASSVTT